MRAQIQRGLQPAQFLMILCMLLGASACRSDQPSPAEATAQASRALSLATHVAGNLSATRDAESLQAEATLQAMESLLAQSQQWPMVIDESFDHNDRNWPTGEGEDPLATIQWEIRDGQYYWQAVANEPFVWWTIPDMGSYANFYLGVDLQLLEGPPDGEAGLVFRLTESDYYLFEVNASQQWSVYLHTQDGWEAVQGWQNSETISTDGPNRLSVVADREFFLLFINDNYLTTLFDTRLASGSAGVLVGLADTGDKGSWVFDNFVLRTQESTAP